MFPQGLECVGNVHSLEPLVKSDKMSEYEISTWALTFGHFGCIFHLSPSSARGPKGSGVRGRKGEKGSATGFVHEYKRLGGLRS